MHIDYTRQIFVKPVFFIRLKVAANHVEASRVFDGEVGPLYLVALLLILRLSDDELCWT